MSSLRCERQFFWSLRFAMYRFCSFLLCTTSCLLPSTAEPIQTVKRDSYEPEHRLRKTPSGIYIAANKAFPELWDEITSEFVEWAERAEMENLEEKIKSTAITYVDLYPGKDASGTHKLVLDDAPDDITSIYRVVDYEDLLYLDDKLSFAREAKKLGLEGTVIPRSFESAKEAYEVLSQSLDPSDLVFIKSAYDSHGAGVTCERLSAIQNYDLPKYHIVQEGVKDPALFEGKKSTIRAFVIIHRGTIYVSTSAILRYQKAQYDENDLSKEAQVTAKGLAEGLCFSGSTQERDDFEEEEEDEGSEWIEAIAEAVERSSDMFQKVVSITAKDPMRYAYIGIDAQPKKDGTVQFIEFQTSPGFFEPCLDSVVSLVGLLFGMDDEDEEDLIKIKSFTVEECAAN